MLRVLTIGSFRREAYKLTPVLLEWTTVSTLNGIIYASFSRSHLAAIALGSLRQSLIFIQIRLNCFSLPLAAERTFAL